MALQPFFSVTPSIPWVNTYDPANPEAPYANAYAYSYGGFTRWYSPWRIGDQSTNDEIILAHDPVDPAEHTIGSLSDDVYRRCAVNMNFIPRNVSTENQYLLLFALRGIQGNPIAQFFVGYGLQRTEELAGDEVVAMLLEGAVSGTYIWITVRLASTNSSAAMGFKGMDCYLL